MYTVNQTPHASGSETANGESDAIDVQEFNEIQAYLSVTAASGTSPTLDVTIKTSYDGEDWYDLDSFTQATGETKELKTFDYYGRYIRFAWALGGTTPDFTFEINLEGRK